MTRDEWAELAGVPPFSLPHRLVERLEERAAIMEYEGNLPRTEAEKLAINFVFHYPKEA